MLLTAGEKDRVDDISSWMEVEMMDYIHQRQQFVWAAF